MDCLLVITDSVISLDLALLRTPRWPIAQFIDEPISSVLRLGCFVMISFMYEDFSLPSLPKRLGAANVEEFFTIRLVLFRLYLSYQYEKNVLAIEIYSFATDIVLSESMHNSKT